MVCATFVGCFLAASLSPSNSNNLDATFEAMFRSSITVEMDRFADIPDIPIPEARIVDIPFTDGNQKFPSADTSAYYTVDGSVLRLIFSPDEVTRLPIDIMNYKPVKRWDISVYGKTIPKGSFLAQNAFGAKKTVRVIENREGAIQVKRLPSGQAYPGITPSKFSELTHYWMEFPVQGQKTRSVIKDVIVRLEFEPSSGLPNVRDNCSASVENATVHYPVKVTTRRCTLLGEISKISFFNRITGETLMTWQDL